MINTEQDLRNRAKGLAPTPARLLELFAIAGRPLSRAELDTLSRTHLPKGTRASWIDLGLADLVDAGLLIFKEDAYECHRLGSEDLALSLARTTAATSLVRALRKIEPVPTLWYGKTSAEQLLRHFRWSFLTGDRHLSELHRRCSEQGLTPLSAIGAQVIREETMHS